MERGEEKGAALVEYVLLFALALIVTMGAIDLVGDASEEKMASTGDGISGVRTPGDDAPDDPGGPDGPGPGGPDGPDPDGPEPDPDPTSTTTSPPTAVASAGFTGSDTDRSRWTWTGQGVARITDDGGTPVVGADVSVRISGPDTDPVIVHVTTDSLGGIVVPVGPYPRFGGSAVARVDLTIVGVDGDGIEWDGVGDRITLRP